MKPTVEDLQRIVGAQEKTIQILAERLENQSADNVSCFALFEQNITLENVVSTRTQELDCQRQELEQALDELKKTQAELLQSQKLQSIGQLAAGIAHEINTPAQYVGSNVDFITDCFDDLMNAIRTCENLLNHEDNELSPAIVRQALTVALEKADLEYIKAEMPSALDACKDGIQRISNIVVAMKNFAYKGNGQLEPFDIQPLIESTIEISRNEWRFIADLETDYDPNLIQIKGMKDELGQVLLNLIVNAAHAIEDGQSDSQEKGSIRVLTEQSGNWAVIRVIDDGCGIPDSVKEKIFDPFFTTKEVGRGSGQGLAIAYNVITEKHGGELRVESEVGKGTTFILRLPIAGPQKPSCDTESNNPLSPTN